jgi:hypothetical protein
VFVICLAYAPVALSFGAIAISASLPTWVPIAFSFAVFAGGAQFAALSVLVTGGGYFAATPLTLNARLLLFGLAIADVFSASAWKTLLGVHLIIDAPAAMAMRETHPDTRRAVFLSGGIATFVVRNLFTAIGAVAGKSLGNIAAFGLATLRWHANTMYQPQRLSTGQCRGVDTRRSHQALHACAYGFDHTAEQAPEFLDPTRVLCELRSMFRQCLLLIGTNAGTGTG